VGGPPQAARKPVEFYTQAVRRPLRLLILGILLAGSVGLGLERAGVERFQCACLPNCWCKRPGLNLFRWITPGRWHSLPNCEA